ncbi:MAG: hypothetical protein WBP41_01575 [Saprospiraceae bacterium]
MALRFDSQTGKLINDGSGGSNVPSGGGGNSKASKNFRRFWKSGLVGLFCSGLGSISEDFGMFFIPAIVLICISGYNFVKGLWLWIFD